VLLSFHGTSMRSKVSGRDFKRQIKRRYPTPVSFYIQAPTQRSDENYVDIDPVVKDAYGIPAAGCTLNGTKFAPDVGARPTFLRAVASIERRGISGIGEGTRYAGNQPA